MKYEGVITHITDIEKIWENQIEKRTVVLEENSDREYKGWLVFDLWGEKVALIDPYKVGDVVTVSLNTKTREYNGRRYNSISAWRIEGNASGNANANTPANTGSADASTKKADDGDDDLPF